MKIAFNSFDKQELKAIVDQFKKNEFTEGKQTQKFEKILSKYFKRKYCICVNSGSSANFLVFKSLSLINKINNDKKKYTVAISGLCWPTTITSIIDSGFNIFLCDIDKKTLNLDLNYLNKNKPKNLKYVVSTPVMGNPNGSDEILNFCKKNNLKLIEDACESLGAKTKSNLIGNIGVSSSFSFYFSHHITTIEGGAILTDDSLQYNLIKSLKSHGWSRNNNLKEIFKIKNNKFIDHRWEFLIPGYNLRLNDINSSLGIVQMKKINSFLKKRVDICKERVKGIRNNKIKIIGAEDNINNSWMGFVILLKDYNTRFRLESILRKNSVDYRPVIAGNIKQHFVNNFYDINDKKDLKNCDEIMERGMVLPVHPFITKKDNKKLISILNNL